MQLSRIRGSLFELFTVVIIERELNLHAHAGQHHDPIQEVHHIAGNKPVISVLALCQKSFLCGSGLVLRVGNTSVCIFVSDMLTVMGFLTFSDV